ncbi:carbamoyltransferase [Azospirillum rugosum]|uniref:Carbamoyltransferase n=2 Tax=Azospirillum rugosum TaxID=416170 RepID=A0ABS4SQC4_9PROT|nr:carbamoyltransferase C-terminal domain-containing protein [Azospirillum rugosum]MBP2294308.1 carbamoyltransferase [Azospirillum rugosum]
MATRRTDDGFMNILGLSFDYHDAAAALLSNGRIIAAVHEERFSRKKNDSGFPGQAVACCLEKAGLTAADLDWVVHYERPALKFDRVLRTAMTQPRHAFGRLRETAVDWLRDGKFEVRERICRSLGVARERVVFAEHHRAHAAAAFFCSPFEEAAVVTIDGVGEFATASIAHGRGRDIRPLMSVRYPHSLGLFYSAFTAYLGFEVNEGEYKVMGMASYGTPRLGREMLELFDLRPDGGFRLRQELFDFRWPEDMPFTQRLIDWLGPPRSPESPFRPIGDDADPDVRRSRHYADVAASVQFCTEEVILHMVRHAMERCGCRQVCLAGGVALNSVANGRIQRELGCDLFVQPAAGDAGSALGAALLQWHATPGHPRTPPLTTAHLGAEFGEADILAAIEEAFLIPARIFDTTEELYDGVAERLAEGSVIGWFQGRAEWGPRALGARSILADPRRIDMKTIVNEKIKFREPFRPFAPSVLAERATEYFELDPGGGPSSPERFMLSVCRVRPDKAAEVPAITHVDGTARVHLVERAANPAYYDLIAAFAARTGTPMLLNTSFNLRGEPIVNAPANAIRTFQWSGMDALVMGRCLLEKGEAL